MQDLGSPQEELQPVPALVAPPKIISRNTYGLIDTGEVRYVFNEDNSINWRKMIKPEYLFPNKQVFQRKNKPIPETIEGLDDSELIIKLGGIKELAQIRGYKSVRFPNVVSPTSDYVIAVCEIVWIANYETNNEPLIFSDMGDASPSNTNGFGAFYLAAIAANRAFVRTVRNSLRINIVSQEEIGGAQNTASTEDIASVKLKETMEKHGVTFEKIKQKLISESFENADKLDSISDIPRHKQFELIERIKTKAAEQAAKQTSST